MCWAHNGYIVGMLSGFSSATWQMSPCASHIISWDLLFLVTTWRKCEVAKGGDPEFLWDFEIRYFFRHCLQGLLNYKRGETEVLMTPTWRLTSSRMFALIAPPLLHPLSMRLGASVMVGSQQYALKCVLWISAQLLTGCGNPISQICRVRSWGLLLLIQDPQH